MQPALTLTLVACGSFFLTGLLTGIWKHAEMLKGPTHQAPVYVDIAHRAALLYSFAALVIAKFVELSPFAPWVNTLAAAAPLFFFASAILRYISLAKANNTQNQYVTSLEMNRRGVPVLIIAEVGGFGVLFVGFLLRRFAGW